MCEYAFSKYFDYCLQIPLCNFCQNYNSIKNKKQLLKFGFYLLKFGKNPVYRVIKFGIKGDKTW